MQSERHETGDARDDAHIHRPAADGGGAGAVRPEDERPGACLLGGVVRSWDKHNVCVCCMAAVPLVCRVNTAGSLLCQIEHPLQCCQDLCMQCIHRMLSAAP